VPSLSMVFDVLAIDRASAVFDRVGDSAGAAGAKVDAATTTTTNAGAKMAAGLGIAAAAAAAYSVKLAADFQTNMTRLVTTAGETAGPNGIGLVSKGILDMAAQVGIGANDLAKGMYTVESAGIHGADALNVLKAAAQGATQEQADLGKTTDALTTILHDYNIPAAQSADVMSKLVTAVSTGKTTLEDFTGSLHSVTPLAAALHVPLADILGDLAAMTASGESADQATQNMADALRHLQAPTAQMTAELAQLGITSQDLSSDLSSKGLAGTMQEIEQAILQHLDPATQRVLLPAFNESKTAAADLVSMIGTMPPALAKLSQGLLDGSVSVKDYRSQVRDMGGQAAASGLQFQSLYQTSDGFNQILKQGGPAAQAFTAALQKAVGDSAGLTVALQLTGEHAATVNDNIAKIAGSSREAGGNIKGWSEVQGNFNQQLHEAGAALESMAIEFGTKLLPYLTDGLHFITTTAIPGIEHLGSAVGAAAHWFSELPGPVKDMALALAALRLADMIGVFDKLSLSMQRFRESMAVQSALGAMEQSAGGAANGVSRLEAAAGLAASRGLAALKAGASGLVSMFGGPWGLAIAGAVLGISAFQSAIERHDQAVQKATQDLIGYYKAIGQGGIGGTDAMAKVAEKQNELSAATQKLNDLIANQNTVYQQAGRGAGGYNSEITVQRQKVNDLTKEFDDAWKALSPLEQLQVKLTEAIQQYGPASGQAAQAAANYQQELGKEKQQTDDVNRAEKTHLQLLQDTAQQQLASVSSTLAAQGAQLGLAQALDQYNKDASDGQHTSAQLAAEQNSLAQTALSAAQAAGQMAADQAKANGITDTGNISNQAMLKSLQDLAQQMGVNTPKAIQDAIVALSNATVANGSLNEAISKMGLNVQATWDNNTRVLKDATDQQIKDLQNLGFEVIHLPNGNVVVTSDTGPARQQLEQLIADYKNREIAIAGGNAGPAAYRVTPGGGLADGGPVFGPGTGTSDTAGLFALSNGEHVWTAAEVNAAGGHGAMESMRKMVLASGGGRADGGPIFADYPARLSDLAVNQSEAIIAQIAQEQMAALAAAAASAGGSGQWSGVAAQALAAEGEGATWLPLLLQRMNQESGGNPAAVNLWDSNAAAGTPSVGLMQVIGPTYARYKDPRFDTGPYAYGVSEDAMANITAAIRYTESTYGSLSAWGQAGGYDSGGWLMPGATLAYNGTGKPERVRTAEQEAALGQSAVFHIYDSDGHLMGTMQGVAMRETAGALTAMAQRGSHNPS
jgi:TP901 family phage tail tape measure protein